MPQNGVIHGMLLGIDNYLPKHKQGEEAVIVNISSTCGLQGYPHIPVYCTTKFAITGMTKSWGTDYHYDRTKVRVVAVCPGVTETPMIFNMAGRNLGGPYEKYLQSNLSGWLRQETDHVAKEMLKVIRGSPNGKLWVVEGGEPAYEFLLPERENMERKYLNV
ncbi:alcohol dehydrogenase 2-like [Anoplophora glabripennis]|uniref:alcohol dehydrogenase 2-like n=1 Tax=Anoplophora glabripennis TaxID=217634 RepID=UPI000874DFB5|nr:alcohol dehydrogenase 2-like [Anoplophora glabripennis]